MEIIIQPKTAQSSTVARGKIAQMHTAHNRARTRIVQSRQNSRVKELRFALSHAGRRAKDPVALEGQHLVAEALRSGLTLTTVFLREGSERLLDSLIVTDETEILILTEDVFHSAVSTETPQGIAALAIPVEFDADDLFTGVPLVVVAAELRDPGNLGTLLRSAEAFGATGMILLPGTVSPWNSKALRASSGSAFRMPVISLEKDAAIALLRKRGLQLLASTVDGGEPALSIDFDRPTALFIGNEGAGLSPDLIAAADFRITIPCPGPVESLNAAIAASVLLYEASRQRSHLINEPPKQ